MSNQKIKQQMDTLSEYMKSKSFYRVCDFFSTMLMENDLRSSNGMEQKIQINLNGRSIDVKFKGFIFLGSSLSVFYIGEKESIVYDVSAEGWTTRYIDGQFKLMF